MKSSIQYIVGLRTLIFWSLVDNILLFRKLHIIANRTQGPHNMLMHPSSNFKNAYEHFIYYADVDYYFIDSRQEITGMPTNKQKKLNRNLKVENETS